MSPSDNEYDEGDRRNFRNSGGQGGNRFNRGGGGGAGGPGGERGTGRPPRGGFDNRGKRVYDRQSGSDKSGVKAVDKRDGHGAHNWGDASDEINEGKQIYENAQEETTEEHEHKADGTTSAEEDGANAAETDESKAVPEPKEMTLDEYRREQEKSRSVPKFNLRKPGEGEDGSQWKKTFIMNKNEGNANEEKHDDDERKATKQTKARVDIEINFANSGRRGPARGGPPERPGGGGAGGGNRRGPRPRPEGGAAGPFAGRSGRSNQCAPKVDDEKDFPSLIAA